LTYGKIYGRVGFFPTFFCFLPEEMFELCLMKAESAISMQLLALPRNGFQDFNIKSREKIFEK